MRSNYFKKSALYLALVAAAPFVFAAEETGDGAEIGLIQIIGSRSHKTRTVADSTVPVDIISSDDLTAMGSTADLTDNLKALIPSYTATPATGDGSAFVRPTSLRGTAPDQTLILVNGKRRHRSALVQFFAPAAGNGAHGVDIGMIPSIAVQRVEVLRDGAASQYGSDAIAGVINFVMKDYDDGGELQFQYGEFDEGESSRKLAFNKGVQLGSDGFLNFSLEHTDNDALSRGILRADAAQLIDDGIVGVGADSPFGDAPFTQSWGRPETSGTRIFINSGVDLGNDSKLYARLGYGNTDGRYRFFYRNPEHNILRIHANGVDGNEDNSLPLIGGLVFDGYVGQVSEVGFTPFLDGSQSDISFSGGTEGEFSDATYYDVGISYGNNTLDYFLNNSINASLGLTDSLTIPQMDFDVGGYEQSEISFNADFSKLMTENINLAYGFEWRKETYTVKAGEPNASIGGGSSGFKGIQEIDSGKFDRSNTAIYVDIEQDISYELLMQYALRYENFSDFGSTVNGKVAFRYNLTDDTALRGAISTGFHAPTPGQANVQTTITTFDGNTGLQVEESLVPSSDPRVVAVGGKELKEENSTNISIGFTTNFYSNATLTVDAYIIAVDDRIYRTGDIAVPNTTNTISFYTNALNVDHFGIDAVLSTQLEWSSSLATDVTFAYSYNEINVTGQSSINGVLPVSGSLMEDIEHNYPRNRFVLTTSTAFTDDINLMFRANFYGSHFDERGTIDDSVQPSAEIDPMLLLDTELNYKLTAEIKLTFGISNLLDSYPDEIGAENANRLSVGLQYPRRSAANYEGRSVYIGASYTFD